MISLKIRADKFAIALMLMEQYNKQGLLTAVYLVDSGVESPENKADYERALMVVEAKLKIREKERLEAEDKIIKEGFATQKR